LWLCRAAFGSQRVSHQRFGSTPATPHKALAFYGAPEIFNTDQGRQFTSPHFTDVLKDRNIKISTDGRGRTDAGRGISSNRPDVPAGLTPAGTKTGSYDKVAS
jgi:transposase InsO family protein